MEENEYIKMHDIEKNHWWFLAKRKYIDIILDRFLVKKEIKALDVGCGTGAVMEFLQSREYKVCGVDKSGVALSFCKKKMLNVNLGSAEKLNFSDNTFDLITALDVLEHLPNEKKALQEIKRVLKPNGIFVATVPAHQFLWSYHDEVLHHFRRYNKKSFLQIFQDNFDVKFVSYIHFFILFPAILIRSISKKTKSKAEKKSDVGESGWFVNKMMSFVYFWEILFFRIFKKLPIGLSLLVVAKKKNV